MSEDAKPRERIEMAEQTTPNQPPANPLSANRLHPGPEQKRNPAKSRKSPATQAIILARSVAGESNRQIARELGIDRGTVSAVLAQPEIKSAVDWLRNELIGLFPKVARAIEQSLDAGDGRLALTFAEKMGATLEGSETLRPQIVLNIAPLPCARPVSMGGSTTAADIQKEVTGLSPGTSSKDGVESAPTVNEARPLDHLNQQEYIEELERRNREARDAAFAASQPSLAQRLAARRLSRWRS